MEGGEEMRRLIISLIVTLLLTLATAVPALAAGPGTGDAVTGILGGVSDTCQSDPDTCLGALADAIGEVVEAATP